MSRTLSLPLLALVALGCGDGSTQGGDDSTTAASSSTSDDPSSNTGSTSTEGESSSSEGSTTGGSTTSASSSAGSETTGSSSGSSGEPDVSPFAGDYEGTATLVCFETMESTDDFAFTVADDGTLEGTVGTGAVMGTVDDVGTVAVPLETKYGSCTMDGTIDDTGGAAGTITCESLPCEGTWEAARQ